MGFIIKTEGAALAALEQKEAEASAQGGATFETFKDTLEAKAIEEAPALGAVGDGTSSSSSDTSDDSSSSDDDFSSDGSDFGSSDDSNPDDDPADSSDDASEEEEEPEEEEPLEEEEDPQEQEAELKKESFRTLSFLPEDSDSQTLIFRQEMFGGWTAASSAVWGGISFVANCLASVGITYGPSLLMGMFKVVLFTFAKTFKTLDEAYDFIASSITRFQNRTSKQQNAIKQLKEVLADLTSKGAVLPEGSAKNLTTNYLEIETSNDYTKNVSDYTEFVSNKVGKFNQALASDFNALKIISENRYLGKNFDALSFMEVQPSKLGFQNRIGSKPGLGVQLETFSLGKMIGNIDLQADLCSGRLDNWSSVEKAYAGSSISLVPQEIGRVVETKLMTPEELSGFLNNLELLAKASLKHQQFYSEISRSRSGVINSIKQLFIRLLEEEGKVSFKNSVALPLHLKSSFATKVYMTGAMDLHDHTAQVIANGLSYASSMMKLYTSQP